VLKTFQFILHRFETKKKYFLIIKNIFLNSFLVILNCMKYFSYFSSVALYALQTVERVFLIHENEYGQDFNVCMSNCIDKYRSKRKKKIFNYEYDIYYKYDIFLLFISSTFVLMAILAARTGSGSGSVLLFIEKKN
jgi:hypothetical protein